MTRTFKALLLLGALAAAAGGAIAEGPGLVSLRGATPLDETNMAPSNTQQLKPALGFGREFRQQPPLIPHRVDGYQVARGVNRCLECHSWPNNANVGAPKVSETHYETRDGERLDEISNRRWFCQQCHVPQENAQALVPNAFKNAREMDGAFN